MEIEFALKQMAGIAKTSELHRHGISNYEIRNAVGIGTVIKLRKGWYAIHTIRPIERRAFIDRGLLTCATAAEVMGLPAASSHYHLRASRPVKNVLTTCRRQPPIRVGAQVGLIDLAEDYLECQPPEWSLALLDRIARDRLFRDADWLNLTTRLPARLRYLLAWRDPGSESPLESILRYKLKRARIPHSLQVPIGRFRADFVIGHGLVLETHGAEFHSSKESWERDRVRTLWLKNNGWDVLEVSYSQVVEWKSLHEALRKHLGRPLLRTSVGN